MKGRIRMHEAIDKIKAEMKENANNPYVQVVGNFLIEHVTNSPDDAPKVLAKDKTIAKSLDAMRKEASKKKVNNVAVLTDAEGFAVVLNYFGINTKTKPATKPTKPTEAQPATDFDVKLDDFL